MYALRPGWITSKYDCFGERVGAVLPGDEPGSVC